MKKILTILAVAALMLFGAMAIQAETAKTAFVGDTAPNFTLTDANGKTHTLADYKGKYVVLEWVNFDCPFVIKHYGSGNMQKLQADYTEKEVVWLAICSSGEGKQGFFKGDDLANAIKNNNSKASAYLIDADGTVGQLYQAKTTPNMYVVDPKGILIYAGAIDSTPSVNPDDIKGSMNYISQALNQVLGGKAVSIKATQPYGCSVKYSTK